MDRYYELVLMLDPEAADTDRERVADDVRKQIESAGTLDRADNWGMRKLAYEIDHKGEGTYHLLTFTAEPETLDEISRVLKITDGVMRHLAVRQVQGARPQATSARASAAAVERDPVVQEAE